MNTIIGMCEYQASTSMAYTPGDVLTDPEGAAILPARTSGKTRADLFLLLFRRADAVYFVSMLAYREICRRENNRRDRLAANGCAEAVARPAEKEDNKSDIDDLAFRYIL